MALFVGGKEKQKIEDGFFSVHLGDWVINLSESESSSRLRLYSGTEAVRKESVVITIYAWSLSFPLRIQVKTDLPTKSTPLLVFSPHNMDKKCWGYTEKI